MEKSNLQYLTTIVKGGDLKKTFSTMTEYFKNRGAFQFNLADFLQDFLGLFVKKYDLDNIPIYIDYNIRRHDVLDDGNTQAYVIFQNHSIFINPDMFTKKELFLLNLTTLVHEMFHIVKDIENNNIVREVGNQKKHCHEQYADLYDIYNIPHTYYYLVPHELYANSMSFEYMYNFINKYEAYLKHNSISLPLYEICAYYLDRRADSWEYYVNEAKKDFAKVKPNIIDRQHTLLKLIKGDLDKVVGTSSSLDNYFFHLAVGSFINHFTELRNLFILNEDLTMLDEVHEEIIIRSTKSPYMKHLFLESLNYINYTVTEQDVKFIVDMFDASNESFALSAIKINQESLIKTICKLKYSNYNKNFVKQLNEEEIKDYRTFCNKYEEKLYPNKKAKDGDEEFSPA